MSDDTIGSHLAALYSRSDHLASMRTIRIFHVPKKTNQEKYEKGYNFLSKLQKLYDDQCTNYGVEKPSIYIDRNHQFAVRIKEIK